MNSILEWVPKFIPFLGFSIKWFNLQLWKANTCYCTARWSTVSDDALSGDKVSIALLILRKIDFENSEKLVADSSSFSRSSGFEVSIRSRISSSNSFILPYSYNQKLQFFHTPEFHGEQKSPLGIWNLDDIKDFSDSMFAPPFSDDKIENWYKQRMGMGGNPEDAQKIKEKKGMLFKDQQLLFETEGKELDFETIIAGIKTYQEYVGRGHHNIVIINASCRGEIDGHINTPFTTQLREEEGTPLQDNNMGMNLDFPPERKSKSKRKNKKSKRKNKKSKRKNKKSKRKK